MRTPRTLEPLWVIAFDHSKEGKTLKEKAFFCISFPNENKAVGTLDPNEQFALDFLERMASSFKEVTEPILHEAEQDESKKAQAEEIRDKFKSIDLWIKWLRKWQDEKPPDM